MLGTSKGERLATMRDEMHDAMEAGVGIYRRARRMQAACAKLAELRDRYRRGVKLDDRSRAFNTEWLSAIELGFIARGRRGDGAVRARSAGNRAARTRASTTSRSATTTNFLKHTLACRTGDGPPRIELRAGDDHRVAAQGAVYGGEGKQAELS